MRRSNLLKTLGLGALTVATSVGIAACGNGGSRELTIVHFDQSILGEETASELGVSIGLKKGNIELEGLINGVLEGISKETRDTWMKEAVERADNNYANQVTTPATVATTGTVGKLVVGLECDYAPFNWTEVKANDYTYPIKSTNLFADGYDIQMARYIASQINYSLEIVKLDWEALIPALENDTINAVIAGMTDTEERRQSIGFSSEYYRSELVLVVRKDSEYAEATSLEAFRGARIVSQVKTVTDSVIDEWVDNFGVKHINPLDTFKTCSIAVQNKTADAMTAELPVATSIVNSTRR